MTGLCMWVRAMETYDRVAKATGDARSVDNVVPETTGLLAEMRLIIAAVQLESLSIFEPCPDPHIRISQSFSEGERIPEAKA